MKMIIKQIKDSSYNELVEKYNLPKEVELEYPKLEIVVADPNHRYDDEWDEEVTLEDYSYFVKIDDLLDFLGDYAVDDLPEELADEYSKYYRVDYDKADKIVNEYMGTHFDELIKNHYKELLEIFRERAEEYASEHYDPEDYIIRYDEY